MILVTGASGFVGSALVQTLAQRNLPARAMSRTRPALLPPEVTWVAAPDLGPQSDWRKGLCGITCVIHCAARVHVMKETATDALAAYRQANVAGTLQLARQAAFAGVKRIVFLSSIKVNGEASAPNRPFTAFDVPSPQDPYALSKWEAEQKLADLGHSLGLETSVVRPPLVYGPGVRANFLTMMRWLQKGFPLPLGDIRRNRRSLVAIDNLTDLLVACAFHPEAAGKTFLAADGQDVSTAELMILMAAALGVPSRLLPVPEGLLRFGARLLGKEDVAQRLLGSLQVDISHTCRTLGWMPPLSLAEGLRRAATSLSP